MQESPRIYKFLEEHAHDPDAALASLRADLIKAGGPLFEGARSPGVQQVTFVCIRSTSQLSLSSGLLPASHTSAPMRRASGTDVWYISLDVDERVATTYQFTSDPLTEADTMGYRSADVEWAIRVNSRVFESGIADEFNPFRIYPIPGVQGGDPGRLASPERYASVLFMPAADPAVVAEEDVQAGTLERRRIQGLALPGDRDVTVYLPPNYDRTLSYPLVVMFDGEMNVQIGELPQILDAAIARGRIPPVVVVFWHNLTIVSRLRELKCHPSLPTHLATELLPWVRGNYAVTRDPAHTVVCGFSLGGLSAAWVGLEQPDDFGAVLAISPSLWWAPVSTGSAPEARGWLTRRYRDSPTAPLRIYLTVGSLETEDETEGPLAWTMVEVAEEFRDVLQAKGYDLRGYRVVPGAHDFVNVRTAIVTGLSALLDDVEER